MVSLFIICRSATKEAAAFPDEYSLEKRGFLHSFICIAAAASVLADSWLEGSSPFSLVDSLPADFEFAAVGLPAGLLLRAHVVSVSTFKVAYRMYLNSAYTNKIY